MRPAEECTLTRIREKDSWNCAPVTPSVMLRSDRRMQKCPARESRAPRALHHHPGQGVELRLESDFFNVSPFAVTAAPEVGESLLTFFPRVE